MYFFCIYYFSFFILFHLHTKKLFSPLILQITNHTQALLQTRKKKELPNHRNREKLTEPSENLQKQQTCTHFPIVFLAEVVDLEN